MSDVIQVMQESDIFMPEPRCMCCEATEQEAGSKIKGCTLVRMSDGSEAPAGMCFDCFDLWYDSGYTNPEQIGHLTLAKRAGKRSGKSA
jgi:hypothetical protein